LKCYTDINVTPHLIGLNQERKPSLDPTLLRRLKQPFVVSKITLIVVKSRQETYANKRRQPLEFEVVAHVYLRVSPMKGVKRFGMKGKLAPHYIRSFPILEKCGTVAYKLVLPPSLAEVHGIFHVSQLKKCLMAHVDVVLPEVTPLEADLLYLEHPIKILDQKDRVTRHKMIKFFKVQWSHHTKEEAMWESEDFLRSHHPGFTLP
jgi:hypothetical protein